MPPVHLGLGVLAAAVVVSLALMGLGAARVAGRGRAIQRRIDAYRALPVLKVAQLTQARVASAQRRAAGIPRLQARATAAVNEILAAWNRVRTLALGVRFAARTLLSLD